MHACTLQVRTAESVSSLGQGQTRGVSYTAYGRMRNFSLYHHICPDTAAHPACHSMHTTCCFTVCEVARAQSCPLTSISFQGQEFLELQKFMQWSFANTIGYIKLTAITQLAIHRFTVSWNKCRHLIPILHISSLESHNYLCQPSSHSVLFSSIPTNHDPSNFRQKYQLLASMVKLNKITNSESSDKLRSVNKSAALQHLYFEGKMLPATHCYAACSDMWV